MLGPRWGLPQRIALGHMPDQFAQSPFLGLVHQGNVVRHQSATVRGNDGGERVLRHQAVQHLGFVFAEMGGAVHGA